MWSWIGAKVPWNCCQPRLRFADAVSVKRNFPSEPLLVECKVDCQPLSSMVPAASQATAWRSACWWNTPLWIRWQGTAWANLCEAKHSSKTLKKKLINEWVLPITMLSNGSVWRMQIHCGQMILAEGLFLFSAGSRLPWSCSNHSMLHSIFIQQGHHTC